MTTHTEIDRALRVSSAAVVAHSQALLQAAVMGGGPELVAKVERALGDGGFLTVTVGLIAGGADIKIIVEPTQPGRNAVVIFDADGTLPTRGQSGEGISPD